MSSIGATPLINLKNLQLAQARITSLEEQNQELKKQKSPKPESELLQEKNKQIEIIALENERNVEKAQKATELLNKQSESVRKAQELINQQAKSIGELQSKVEHQEKTIKDLEKQAKTSAKEPSKLFTCSQCSQEWSLEFLRLVDKNHNKTCAECLENMLELTKQATGKEIIIEEQEKKEPEKMKPCQFCSKLYPQSHLKPRHILNLPNHDPREISFICQECLIYRAKKADYYCPLTSEGKDLYEGKEFDCYCPTNL